MDRRKCVTPTRLATWFEDATLAGNRDEQPGVGWSALHCPPCLHCVTGSVPAQIAMRFGAGLFPAVSNQEGEA